MTDLRLAVFDCDGTLVDSQHSIVQAMLDALDSHGLELPAAHKITRMVGLPLEEAIARLIPDADREFCAQLSHTYKAAFTKMRENGVVEEPLFPGIIETLDSLTEEGWLLGIATGKAYRGLKATLAKHNILDRFVTCQTADKAHGKPHPDMMLRAMNETGTDPSMAIMIGDTTYDVEMAISAHTRAVGVNWGYHEKSELLAAGAYHVADDGEGLVKTLLHMMATEDLSK